MTDSITLTRKRIYILPNRHGMMIAVVLMIMLITSLNYGISTGLACTFLLTGVFLTSLFHTFRNLHGLRLSAGPTPPTFAGKMAQFQVNVDNSTGTTRRALSLALPKQQAPCQDIAANAQGWLTLSCPAPRRGWLTHDLCHLSTTFPLGIVRGWSILRLKLSCLVYPAPEYPPPPLLDHSSGTQGLLQEGEDFMGLRAYQPGDAPKHIHWKSWARAEVMHIKQFASHHGYEIVFDFNKLAPLDTEARLSRLCSWVVQADQEGHRWGLRLPEIEIPISAGHTHLHACLRALALHGL
ncbi:MAG: DUF58 domain-containing protein [Magnetococcus sp. YQC-5]